MAETVDARGLSCPQPVLLTLSKLGGLTGGECSVIVDNEVSMENVCRAASNKGWSVDSVIEDADEYKILLKK
jgi:TusA-related sulfurtransferase